MPLRAELNPDSQTKILVWNVTETLEDLFDQTVLTDRSIFRLGTMQSAGHKRGFLGVRMLLQHVGYNDHDLYYDQFGKPHLHDGKHISISHSHDFSAVIISAKTTGLDLELQREKILKIADRFNDNSHIDRTDRAHFIRTMTVIWGVKEAVFKIRNEPGISFTDHIIVAPFALEAKRAAAKLHFNGIVQDYDVHFEEIDGYTLVYAFEKQS
jgi:phosphopantetheinyl transferase